MLDQNTDRMWYVIGAVIIGAAIILILNNTFPQLFASVGETFGKKVNETNQIVDGIMPKTEEDDLFLFAPTTGEYELVGSTHHLRSDKVVNKMFFGLGFSQRLFDKGESYVLSFTLKKNSGVLDYIGGHSDAFTTTNVVINGESFDYNWDEPYVTHDPFNYENGVYHVSVYLTYNANGPKYNDLYIQPNREYASSGYDVEISNLNLVKK